MPSRYAFPAQKYPPPSSLFPPSVSPPFLGYQQNGHSFLPPAPKKALTTSLCRLFPVFRRVVAGNVKAGRPRGRDRENARKQKKTRKVSLEENSRPRSCNPGAEERKKKKE